MSFVALLQSLLCCCLVSGLYAMERLRILRGMQRGRYSQFRWIGEPLDEHQRRDGDTLDSWRKWNKLHGLSFTEAIEAIGLESAQGRRHAGFPEKMDQVLFSPIYRSHRSHQMSISARTEKCRISRENGTCPILSDSTKPSKPPDEHQRRGGDTLDSWRKWNKLRPLWFTEAIKAIRYPDILHSMCIVKVYVRAEQWHNNFFLEENQLKQLGPIIMGEPLFNEFHAQMLRSLMERLSRAGFPIVTLDFQARQHPVLFNPANDYFYGGKVKTVLEPHNEKFALPDGYHDAYARALGADPEPSVPSLPTSRSV